MRRIFHALFVLVYWVFSLPLHFQAHWFFAGIACIFVSMTNLPEPLRWPGIIVGLTVSVCSGSLLLPYTKWTHRKTCPVVQVDSPVAITFKVLHSNVQIYSKSFQLLATLIANEKADFLCLTEVTDDWLEALRKTGVLDAYEFFEGRTNTFFFCKEHQVMLFSRHPFKKLDVYFGKEKQEEDATIIATIELEGQLLKVVAMHPRVPLSPFYFARQLRHLRMLSAMSSQICNTPLVFMGDMNSTPWLPSFRRMCQALGLRDARLDKAALLNTWPVPFQMLGIPIDFILVSNSVTVEELRAGPGVGSDHLPLIARLSVVKTQS